MFRARYLTTLFLLLVAPAIGRAQDGLTLYDSPDPVTPAGELDRIVFQKLESLGIKPVLCSDAAFVRRVYLDVTGTIPTAAEARQFIEDPDTENKRAALIDQLLESQEYATYQAMKWADILRIKAEFPVNLWPNAAQAYHRWVLASVAENKPYDRFARELLTSSGSNFRVGPVNFYRAIQNRTPEGITGAVALAFLGSRADSWSPERVQGMTAFFSQVGYKPTREWKEEIVFWDPLGTSAPFVNADTDEEDEAEESAEKPAAATPEPPKAPEPLKATFPDGTSVTLPPDRDPREAFADWLIRPENPYFTRTIANRAWSWLLGRGIVHEPDDFRDDNPPSNPELLAFLEKQMVANGYDMKKFYRMVLNSRTYQLSSVPRFEQPEAEANFATYAIRRLEAEVLIDAINQITGSTDLYTSAIPEPYSYIPKGMPAVAIADGSITSSFLTLFGRSARATGMENERSNKPVPSQWLYMLNSSQVQSKLEQGPHLKTILEIKEPERVIDELYLTILSRPPTPDERKIVAEHLKSGAGRTAAIDLTWSLLNSPEFLYRH